MGESSFVFCVRTGQEHGGGGGGLCEASHCYMMPEGGYQSNGSQDAQEREGGLNSEPGTRAHFARNRESGKGRDKRGKDRHQVRSPLQPAQDDINLRNRGYEDVWTVIKQYNDYYMSER